MNHLMLDLETMGTRPGAAIVSLAAVQFDIETGRIGKEFYRVISLQSCFDLNLKAEAGTIFWWFKQATEAQAHIMAPGAGNLADVLKDFAIWLNQAGDAQYMQLWGNSARFDMGILEMAFRASRVPVPWNTWTERCVRTLDAMAPEVRRETKFEGLKHYPVDDCKHQIKYVCGIYRKINGPR